MKLVDAVMSISFIPLVFRKSLLVDPCVRAHMCVHAHMFVECRQVTLSKVKRCP